ncbi:MULTISPECIES: SPOR domain-containing protein [unclassified Pseudoalteromonas]|uniref:SPOR domain-containing protein n=1 Tax=unclassified Pseudoalteromonas TaxID=194690 RepID=UPI000C071A72|nr:MULTISPECIES: SPOR domain-containing protein [unclassified Pseudoalteromonas]MDP2634862.1 SPOR domain-containing protein [Pseudoalteromonas sp. 1_MG-2023]PHN88386.1 SPOR domain-containing protein [Pseudoalteromonas sp. 3D05]
MHITLRIWLTLMLAVMMAGCAMNESHEVDDSSSLISDQQVKEYVAQWQQQQGSINRLASMENDLKLLIMALSSNSQLAQGPSELRSERVDVLHGNQATQTDKSNVVGESIYQTKSDSLAGAQLGLYLRPELVKLQIVRLHREYPHAFKQLDFLMTQRENKGVTLYGLRVGPFQDYTEANTFCLIAKNMGQKCLSAPFVGQPI